jgi:hypothetical protein
MVELLASADRTQDSFSMGGLVMVRRWLPVVMAVMLAGTFTAGVATAVSTAGSGARACESSKGVLALLSKKSKCPAHDRKVTLGATGPRGPRGTQGPRGIKGGTGPQGPGALLTEADSVTPGQDTQGQAVPLAGTHLFAQVDCEPGNGSRAAFQVGGAMQGDTTFAHGTAQVAAIDGDAFYDDTAGEHDLTSGTNLVSAQTSGAGSGSPYVAVVGEGGNDQSIYFDLLVNVGSTNTAPNPSFTITGWLYESDSHCQADAQVTPATAPTS